MEMVVNGVSTRKVSHIVEELCGRQISQSKVSELGKGLSQKVNQFKNRPLGEYWDLRPLDNAHARHTKKKTQPKVVSFYDPENQRPRDLANQRFLLNEDVKHTTKRFCSPPKELVTYRECI